jgi:hypothetical protein
LGALAYTKGTEIHIGPGQEKHLPHEMWHAVQQKQGRVKPTRNMKGHQVNDNPELEKEADVIRRQGNQKISDKGISRNKFKKIQREGTIKQLKKDEIKLNFGIKRLNNQIIRSSVNIEYDDEQGITVENMISQVNVAVQKVQKGFYQIEIIFYGTHSELDNDLKRPSYLISGKQLKAINVSLCASCKEVDEKDMNSLKERDKDIITIPFLVDIIKKYKFTKIVTGNHINGATKGTNQQHESVRNQQINEMGGRTLFIDPLFKSPGNEWQYHDQLITVPNASFKIKDGIYIIQSNNVFLGVLPMKMYSDEVSEVVTALNIEVKFYITETRPVNIIKIPFPQTSNQVSSSPSSSSSSSSSFSSITTSSTISPKEEKKQ